MKIIAIEEAVDFENIVYIDVRSPKEYSQFTIPGAINIPLFTDEDREEIGCLYNRDKEAAYEKGFQIGTSKLYNIYKKIKTLFFDKDQKIVIFCWRGGMRSKSIVVNLNMMGINVYQLKGGYKSYRKYILDQLNCINNRNNYKYYVLHGNTGVEKPIC